MRVRLEPLVHHVKYKARVEQIDRVLVWSDDGKGSDFPLFLAYIEDLSDFPELLDKETVYAIMTFEREGAA